MTRYIFVTGGVVSSLGKGLAGASLAALLQARGFSIRMIKLDPYLNVDPGTMSPAEHGECFVTNDGAETDLDIGHYERFTGRDATSADSISQGRIYSDILSAERRGDFLGKTIQIVPHVTDAIKRFITTGNSGFDFTIVEVGGTVGDIEGTPFFEAIRQLRQEMPFSQTLSVHLTLLPYIPTAGELKTKPTQHSVATMRSIGLQPNILLCRSDRPIPPEERRKLASFCSVHPSSVIEALDARSIYDVPLAYHREGLDVEVLRQFGVTDSTEIDLAPWERVVDAVHNPAQSAKIGIIAKYPHKDAYKSLVEAIAHGGIACNAKVESVWIDAEALEAGDLSPLSGLSAVIVPGGFGKRGTEGKIAAIRYCRETRTPFLGICLGMQLACIEAARNQLGFPDASSTEFGDTPTPIVAKMTEWMNGDQIESRAELSDLGGTMRLGAFDATLEKGSLAHKLYGTSNISERHRHRYEVNTTYKSALEGVGLRFSGMSPDGLLPEIVERHGAFFIAVQFHPELKSRPLNPHPLFSGLIRAALQINSQVSKAA
jgi:CTP synthase